MSQYFEIHADNPQQRLVTRAVAVVRAAQARAQMRAAQQMPDAGAAIQQFERIAFKAVSTHLESTVLWRLHESSLEALFDQMDVASNPGEARALLERWGAQVWDGEDPNAHEALRQRRIEPDLAVLFGPLPQDVAPSHFARSVTRAFGKRPPTIFLCDRRPSPKTLGDAWFLPAPVKPAAFRSLATHLLRQGDAGDASAPPGQD